MSSTAAIRAHALGKRYAIGAGTSPYRTIREAITGALRRERRSAHVWALRDVSFEIAEGGVVGLIGRNGAGKSTLLKILSRITEPTEGEAETRGRVASLLDVGTGMHPELTGRENIYLGGIVLGMRRHEIDRRFEEMVAFAEVERFLDTPVKRYSTGMFLRLAFSVAAHLEPEILLVDEVLAVGDAAFQRKCLGKMQAIGASGRTVIFVSHNMPAVTRICPRTILLAEGNVVDDGPSACVVTGYLRSGLGTLAERRWEDPGSAPGGDIVRLRAVRLIDENGETVGSVDVRHPLGIRYEYDVLRGGYPLVPEFGVVNEEGIVAFGALDTDPRHAAHEPGRYVSTAWIPSNFLAEGVHIVHVGIITAVPQMRHAWEPDALTFMAVDTLEGDSARGEFAGHLKGAVRPLLRWEREVVG